MKPEHIEVLSALFDGERVNPSLLAEALADPRAVDVLADFASLRVLALEDSREPSEVFYGRVGVLMRRKGLRDRMARFVLPALAAGLLLTVGATGFVLRSITEQPRSFTITSPPPPLWPAATVSLPTLVPALEALPPRPRGDAGVPPDSALRIRFTRWQETTNSLGHRPE